MATFLVSDWHIGETRWDIMGRPFDTGNPEQDIQTHIDTMVANHNKLVKPDDLVYVNGDVLYQKADPKFLEQIARFNGNKILTRGNHDRPFTDEQFKPYFKEIYPEGVGIEVDLAGVPCYVQHYPSKARADKFSLIGHVHGAFKVQLNMLNVGVDCHHFYPVPEEKVGFFFNAIVNYYDLDCWAAYNEVNEIYRGIRGKQSTYLT